VKKDNEKALIEYGRQLMARATGHSTASDPDWAARYVELLAPAEGGPPAEALQSVFSLVYPEDRSGEPLYVNPVPLNAGEVEAWNLMPVAESAAAGAGADALYDEFERAGGDHEEDFLRFFHLMRKFASTLPAVYGEPGVSLFEQWKMIAALVAISDNLRQSPKALALHDPEDQSSREESDDADNLRQPPKALALVGGDIPGIQRTINTVTSKGAAKAMRGRSAFIQLLGHAVVERLLRELELGPANVVYDAGGNFVLLAGDAPDLATKIADISTSINAVLLRGIDNEDARFDGFHGDLALALAAVPLEITALRVPAPKERSPWSAAEGRLKQAVAAAKQRAFADLALGSEDGWRAVFDPEPADTDDFCAVCRRSRRATEPLFERLDPDAPEDAAISANRQCPECEGFGKLANALGHRGARLLSWTQPRGGEAWQSALHAIAGRWYAIGKDDEFGHITLALDMEGFPADGVDGFRLLNHTTPLDDDGSIKTNEEIAAACETDFKRLGVLRMDVDDLSALLVEGLRQRTAMQTAELSQALERFFAGRLDRICECVDGERDLFYVLFAGGDDLLVIGPWDLMPRLAQAVEDEFEQYVGGHPAIHLSAGIAVVGEKAPLHAAAEQADEALHEAKAPKDAITFLGRMLPWDAFRQADDLRCKIEALLGDRGLPESLLTTLLAVDRRYQQDKASLEPRPGHSASPRAAWGPYDRSDGGTVQALYGPWMWRQAYAMGRLKAAHSEASDEIADLQTALLDGRIEHLGLAARWVRWLRRKEK
jgi:CRISPR-associated protein Csm1